jgi:hypothetical protein
MSPSTTPASRDRRSHLLEMEGDVRGDGRRHVVGVGKHWGWLQRDQEIRSKIKR